MQRFAQTAEAISATTKKTEKVRITAEYLKSLPVEEAVIAAVFLAGRAFPAWEETTLQVGGALLWRALQEVAGGDDQEWSAAYRRYGDLGAAARDIFAERHPQRSGAELTLSEVESKFRQMAQARGPTAKLPIVTELLSRADPLEAKYLVKIITGELRIGLRESLVEEGIARAYEEQVSAVQRANMLTGDIGETLRLAAVHRLSEARMRMFHPVGFMLASPADTAQEAFEYIEHAAVEDKYDGIRAQAHIAMLDGSRGVKLFSRTLDEVTESFPELPPALAAFTDDVILDGEIVAWASAAENGGAGRALPFSQLQQRLGRKHVTEAMMRRVPVSYVVFDVLYAAGELTIDKPLRARHAILDRIFSGARQVQGVLVSDPQGALVFEPAVPEGGSPNGVAPAGVLRAPVLRAESAQELEQLFEAALARGNEGLMIKDVESPYTPGRRGKSWLKLKRELATLDVVVTAVELGHGKRAGVLSDYTFAIRDGDKLLNVGKAYSGLTDAEILEMTKWFLEHTIEDQGFRRTVEPKVVLEVAFNNVMKSDRHSSGYALRFPRIVRLRHDKPPEEADTIERAKEIFDKQGR